MTANLLTQWICDACDFREMADRNSHQAEWARLGLAQPPRANLNDAQIDVHLCPSCLDRVLQTIGRDPANQHHPTKGARHGNL